MILSLQEINDPINPWDDVFLGKVIPGGAQSVELRPDVHTKMLKLETKTSPFIP